jgi:hypothetical protein
VVESINPLDHNTGDLASREGDPFGRLQWFDQDLLFCLSLEFFRRNCQSTHITLDQTSVLEWIGYKQVHDPPYAEIRSAIKRMSWTQIAWYRKGEKEQAKGLDLLSKESGWERGTRSRPGEILALLSDSWLKQIYDSDGDRQIIDLTRYFHLVRYLRATDGVPDIVRSIYTFLASFADQKQKTVVKTDWLIERWAQRQLVRRKDPATGLIQERVHLRYADPLRQGQLADAIKALSQCGICSEVTLEGDRLRVHWQTTKAIAALPQGPRQQRIVDTDLRTGNSVLLVDHEGLPDLRGKSVEEVAHELRRRSQISVDLDTKLRKAGWQSLHLAAVYGTALLQVHDIDPEESWKFVARTLTTDDETAHPSWADWWPAAIAARDPAVHTKLFGPHGLFHHQAAEILTIPQGPTTVAAADPATVGTATLPTTAGLDERKRRLMRLIEGAHGRPKLDEVIIQAARYNMEKSLDDWCSLTTALTTVVGPQSAKLLMMAVDPDGAATVLPATLTAVSPPAVGPGWDGLLNYLRSKIPKLTSGSVARWRQLWNNDARLVAMLAEVIEEKEDIVAHGKTLAQRAGLYAKVPEDDRWERRLQDADWCLQLQQRCRAKALSVPEGLQQLIDAHAARLHQEKRQRAEQRAREEQAVVERADRDRQKATERATAAAARRRELQTQLRGHLMPILIYWQVGDRCDQACELLLSQPMAERWMSGIQDRDLETLRQIFKPLLDRGLVDESWYPFKDTMPPKPIPKPSTDS